MAATTNLQKARAHYEAGRMRQAVDVAWRAANEAFLAGDGQALQSVIDLADAILAVTDGRVAEDARQLATYCRNCLDGSGATVESSTVLARISRMRQPRRTCPDCAEKIPAAARVCRYCGLRFDIAPEV